MNVWIVFRFIGGPWHSETVGVFDTEAAAVDACRDETYWVGGGLVLNESLPHETIPWPEVWYPHLESKEEGTSRCRELVEATQ